jgi:formamidopyrimidine-DNA glycosylase
MPELPELEVVCEVLQRRVVGQVITGVLVRPPGGPVVVRDLTGGGFQESLSGASIRSIARRGKFLVFSLQAQPGPLYLVLNPKLSGRLQLAAEADKLRPKTHVIFSLADGQQLRYFDHKQMGQLYLALDLAAVPGYGENGPEALEISPEAFRSRLKPYRGDIKGVLTQAGFVAGIGNAYADEILWQARLHPYRKANTLTADEVDRLFEAMRATLLEAIDKVRQEMGEKIETERRDFFAVHMKAGQPCPRCGTPVSEVTANQRITNFCRTCQPGGLIKGMG